jgi:hypothetical protein
LEGRVFRLPHDVELPLNAQLVVDEQSLRPGWELVLMEDGLASPATLAPREPLADVGGAFLSTTHVVSPRSGPTYQVMARVPASSALSQVAVFRLSAQLRSALPEAPVLGNAVVEGCSGYAELRFSVEPPRDTLAGTWLMDVLMRNGPRPPSGALDVVEDGVAMRVGLYGPSSQRVMTAIRLGDVQAVVTVQARFVDGAGNVGAWSEPVEGSRWGAPSPEVVPPPDECTDGCCCRDSRAGPHVVTVGVLVAWWRGGRRVRRAQGRSP